MDAKYFNILIPKKLLYLGRVAYVAGGAGTVGRGIVEALLKEEAKVWISSRDENRLNEIKNSLPVGLRSNLHTIKSEIDTEVDCARVRDEILRVDKQINHVVSSLGNKIVNIEKYCHNFNIN
jgi:NAD(P)-dependent dehydrogenase (short-subunit alcohol dehydrogenase family)